MAFSTRVSLRSLGPRERAVNFCETGAFAHKHQASSRHNASARARARSVFVADLARLGMENARVS